MTAAYAWTAVRSFIGPVSDTFVLKIIPVLIDILLAENNFRFYSRSGSRKYHWSELHLLTTKSTSVRLVS